MTLLLAGLRASTLLATPEEEDEEEADEDEEDDEDEDEKTRTRTRTRTKTKKRNSRVRDAEQARFAPRLALDPLPGGARVSGLLLSCAG
ncbi:MAG: hypothetical protein IPO30_18310 [Hyphomonadaceae bacterium]|nr:hypothetical protein [Hyphomonadaceae bacterium]